MEIVSMTLTRLCRALQNKEISALEATEAYLRQIEKKEDQIGAYITVCPEQALSEAREVDRLRMQGEPLHILAGVPGAIKDNICTKGIRTTCASKILADFIPPYDATVIRRLKERRVITLGKANMDEFAMGTTTETSYFKTTKNPLDITRVPGGSSGGSAAAVAACEAAFALGSDTGGSIREPAAFCGVVGVKPTYGVVSRFGLVGFASSFDQIGPLTKTVEDSALVLEAIAGHDKRDATSAKRSLGPILDTLKNGVKGMRIALIKEQFEDLNQEIKVCVEGAIKTLEGLGAEFYQVSVPSVLYAFPAYYVLSSAEASSNLARFDGVRFGYSAPGENMEEVYLNTRSEGFGWEVKRRIILGAFVLNRGCFDTYYKKAQQVRTLITQQLLKVFEGADLILSPTVPTTAHPFGQTTDDPTDVYSSNIYTVPANLAGLPALSMPWGKDSANMPVGIQLMGAPFGEGDMYRAAYALEQGRGGGA